MSLRVPWCDGDLIGDNFQGDLLVSMSSDSVPMGINLSFMLLSSLCIDTHWYWVLAAQHEGQELSPGLGKISKHS